MRFQAASLSLVMMTTSITPALAQEPSSAEPVAPLAPLRATSAPSAAPYAPQETEWNSPGMAAGGTVLTVLGGAGVLAVVAFMAGEDFTGLGWNAGLLGLGGSALFLGIGIPLIVVGAKEVPVDDVHPMPQSQLRVGAGSAEFSMAF